MSTGATGTTGTAGETGVNRCQGVQGTRLSSKAWKSVLGNLGAQSLSCGSPVVIERRRQMRQTHMVLLWLSCGFPACFQIVFLWLLDCFSIVSLWFPYDRNMFFSWVYYGLPVVYLQLFCRFPWFPESFSYFLSCSYGFPIIFQ